MKKDTRVFLEAQIQQLITKCVVGNSSEELDYKDIISNLMDIHKIVYESEKDDIK